MPKRIVIFLLFLFLQLAGSNAFAQKKTAGDSLLSKASRLFYNDPKQSVQLALKAYDLSAGNNSLQISALITVSNAYFALKNSNEAKKYAFKALRLSMEVKDYINQIKVYGMLGNHYQVLKMNDKARTYLRAAEEVMDNHPLPEDMRFLKGNIFAIKGNSYKDDLDCDFAITYFDKAIFEFTHTGFKPAGRNLKLVQVQKGFCLLEKPMADEAIALSNTVEKNTSPQVMYDTWIYAKIGTARALFIKNEFAQAAAILEEALAKSKDIGTPEVFHELYRNLSQNYLNLKESGKYHYYSNLYHITQTGISEAKITSAEWLANETIGDYRAKQAEEKKTFRLYLVFTLAIGGIIVSAIGISISRKQKKAHLLMETIFRKTHRV